MNASFVANYAAIGIVGAVTSVSCEVFHFDVDALADSTRCVLSNALLFYCVYASYFFVAALVLIVCAALALRDD